MASWAERSDTYFIGTDTELHQRDHDFAVRWGLYEEPQPRQREVVITFTQTGAEWVAWHRGSRWCRRCKLDLKPAEESCWQCGAPAYGKVAE